MSEVKWCYDCWVRPANAGGVFCDGCEDNLNDGVMLEVAGPWCAKCNLWPVAFRGDFCDDCLPGKPRKPAARQPALPIPARKAPTARKAPPIPKPEDEVTYLPSRRQTGARA